MHLQEKCIVAETLTTTCVVAMTTCMRGIQSKRKLETLDLSNNTVKCRIHDLSTDAEKQLVSRLNPLNAELNPIFPLIALFGAHHILHVSR